MLAPRTRPQRRGAAAPSRALGLARLALAAVVAAAVPLAAAPAPAVTALPQDAFQQELTRAERALSRGAHEEAEAAAVRALERDGRNPRAWAVRAAIATAAGDEDLATYCLHRELRLIETLAASESLPRKERRALKADLEAKRTALIERDPIAPELLGLREEYAPRFVKVAEAYEKAGRPHGAIRVWKEVLALDPENAAAKAAVERIASAPDPSLAADAKPVDLFADVTDEWIAEHDAEHGTWKEAAKVERDNYVTVTDAGYEVLIRTAEAMEQMAAFYKQFFRYGTPEDGRSVSRITVHVFKNRDEYLEKGIGPPVEWSAGHFTGSHVECYIPESGFAGMVGTLFHEAAHQYVSLATNARSWLNEGLASFFEGTRILPNGAVVMNEPADHRLFPLAERMERGWMEYAQDGFDANDPNAMPEKAPTWRIVVESAYSWGPPWYAPTWGVVFFCYNYQDPVDGRFVYRDSFMRYVDKQGGKAGKTAIKTFEEVVLADPKPAYKSLDGEDIERPDGDGFALPGNVDELTEVWKDWILALRDERMGRVESPRPFGRWARLAAANGDHVDAREHFEKGVLAAPDDTDLALDFARHLSAAFEENDRAAKIVEDALRMMEAAAEPDLSKIAEAERLLSKLDPSRRTLTRTRDDLAADARSVVGRYTEADRPAMIQEVAWRFGTELGLTDLFEAYADAVEARGEDLSIWTLAYNESDLEGWTAAMGDTWQPNGRELVADNGAFDEGTFDFTFLTLDTVTGGDMSLEAEVRADQGRSAFVGFVFGGKSADVFHGAVYFPPRKGAAGTASTGYVDLMSSFGGNVAKTWRHVPAAAKGAAGRSTAGNWNKLRLDVTGRLVDIWWNGELVASQEFASADLLLGRFGVMTGSGAASFRNVRYLAREARSPAGRIERRLRVPEVEIVAGEVGTAVNGSFLGQIPPMPRVTSWVQEPRESWEEAGRVPQLLVLWTIAQNDLVPIDGWLNKFQTTWDHVGLRIVSVAGVEDRRALKDYLAKHKFPGSVAADKVAGRGVGRSFQTFEVERFNLPRVLLIGPDGTVVWEGDPGFSSRAKPKPPYASYLDLPMKQLVENGKLVEVAEWLDRWDMEGEPALAGGDLLGAAPLLAEARALGDVPYEEVRRAARYLTAVEDALADPTELLEGAEAAGAAPAIAVLREWAVAMGVEYGGKAKRALAKGQKGAGSKDWKAVASAVKKARKKAERGDEDGAIADVMAELGSRSGALVDELRDLLDEEGAAALEVAESIPARWLARYGFGW